MASVSSDFNLTKINTKEYSEHLRATIDYGGNLFVVSRRGSGKTAIAKQQIKEAGYSEVYWSLATAERTDGAGFPRLFDTRPDYKYVEYILPQLFKPLIEGDRQSVLLLDEVDKAQSDLWATLLELTQFHTLNGRPLNNLKAVVMTGNFQAEGGARPALPLLDRGERFMLEASTQHWLDWAAKTRAIHPSVTAFINDHPDELFGDVDPGDVYADPSPRGWHNASNILFFGEERKWSPRLLTAKVAGCVGKKTGIKYSSYFEHYVVLLPYVEAILRGEMIKDWEKLEPSKQLVTNMIVCARLAGILDKINSKRKEYPKEVFHIGNFLGRVDPEMALISFRSMVGLDRSITSGIDEVKEFDSLLRNIVKRMQ